MCRHSSAHRGGTAIRTLERDECGMRGGAGAALLRQERPRIALGNQLPWWVGRGSVESSLYTYCFFPADTPPPRGPRVSIPRVPPVRVLVHGRSHLPGT